MNEVTREEIISLFELGESIRTHLALDEAIATEEMKDPNRKPDLERGKEMCLRMCKMTCEWLPLYVRVMYSDWPEDLPENQDKINDMKGSMSVVASITASMMQLVIQADGPTG